MRSASAFSHSSVFVLSIRDKFLCFHLSLIYSTHFCIPLQYVYTLFIILNVFTDTGCIDNIRNLENPSANVPLSPQKSKRRNSLSEERLSEPLNNDFQIEENDVSGKFYKFDFLSTTDNTCNILLQCLDLFLYIHPLSLFLSIRLALNRFWCALHRRSPTVQ